MKKKRPSFLVVLAAILFFLFQVTPLFGFEEELLTPTMSVLLGEPTEEPEINEVETSLILEETPVSSPALSPAVFSSPAAFFEEKALPASNAAESAMVSSEPSPEATAETASQVTVSPAPASAGEEAPPKKSGLFFHWNGLKRFLRVRTLSLTEKDFQADEKVKINLRDYKAAELKILIFDHQGREVEIMAEEDNGDINISPQKTLRPGRYTLKAFEGEELVLEENFTWGVLAVNTHKSIYQPQETAKLAMAVLDEEGNMVCDAKVELRIKNEKQAETVLSTDEGTIKVNPECQLHDFTLNPDYEAEYEVGEAGVYEMELTAETKNGRYTVIDSFEVRNEVPFEVERITATRIYPPASYPVVFKIKVNQDFKGEIVETVPQDFEIIAPTDEATPEFRIEEGSQHEEKLLIWSADWREGETRELSYQFKAPNISPQFYLLGPLAFRQTVKKINLPKEALRDEATTFSQQIDSATQTIADSLLESSPSALAKESVNVVITEEIVVFQEIRQWQIAADAITFGVATASGTTAGYGRTGNGNLTVNLPTGWVAGQFAILLLYSDQGKGSVPTGWTQVTGSPWGSATPKLQAFYRFLQTGDGNPVTTISGSGTNISHVGAIATFNGIDTTTPVEVVGTASAGTGTPMTAGSINTLTNGAWALGLCGRGDNENASGQSFGGSTTGVLERFDSGTSQGNDSQVSLYTKEIASAGATGNGSATTSATDPWVSVIIALRQVQPALNQAAYRWFANDNSKDVGTPLATQDTGAIAPAQGTAFRLRELIDVSAANLVAQGQSFKLQFAQKSGTCDTDFVGESYSDVSPSSGAIRFYNNTTPNDGDTATPNANDPTYLSHTKVMERYEEQNPTDNVNAIPAGQAGLWDFSLVNNSAPAGTSYCFRIKKSGTYIANAAVVKDIGGGGTIGGLSYGTWDGNYYWIGNFQDHTLHKINPAGAVVNTYTLASDIKPLELAWDGTYIWVASADTYGKLVKFNPATGQTVATYTKNPDGTGEGGIQGIIYDSANNKLWIGVAQNNGGAGTGLVIKLDPANPATNICTSSDNQNVSGLTHYGDYVWATNGTTDLMAKIAKSDCSRSTYSTGDNPVRIDNDGTYVYTANYGASNVTKRQMSDGSLIGTYSTCVGPNTIRFDNAGNYWTACDDGNVKIHSSSGAELDSLTPGAVNDHINGLVFDGDYMWVNNYTTSHVYKMNTGEMLNTYMVVPEIQTVGLGTSTAAEATAQSFQRKTWYDGTRHWLAFNSGNEIQFYYSPDSGSNWFKNFSASISVATNDFSIEADSTNAFIVYTDKDGIKARKASSYPGTAFSWGAATTVGGGVSNVTFDAVTTAKQNLGTNLTFSHTTSGTDRLLIVGLSYRAANNPSAEASTITYGGTSLTKIRRDTNSHRNTELWYLVAPATGSNTVSITMSLDPEDMVAAAISYTGVNQSTPLGNNAGNVGEGTSESVTVSSAAGELVLGIIATYPNGNANNPTSNSGQTERWNTNTGTNNITGAGADKAGAASVTVGWTSAESFTWAASGVSVKPSGGPTLPTLTRDSSNKVWVTYTVTSGSNYLFKAIQSTTANDISSWGTAETLDTSTNSNKYGVIVPQSSGGNMYAVWIDGTTIEGKKYVAGTGWDASATSIATGTTGLSNNMSAVTGTTNYYIHLLYLDSNDYAVYRKYTTSWQAAITLDGTAGCDYATISINTSNNNLYAFWIRSNVIYYKKGVSPYGSANWDSSVTSWQATGTNKYVTSNYSAAGMPFAEWTEGTTSPYTIKWDSITSQAPSPPTNVSATDGTYTDKVVVTWTKSTGATGYKVYEGSNLLATLGDVATYDDTTAPVPTITPGTASASDGTFVDYVALSLSGQSANNGSSRTYKVIAYNDAGDSGDSNTDTGYRGVGSLTYQWQRSAADSDADYSNIDGATTAFYNDTGAPANGDGRYYHCVLNATGASQQTSTSDRGYRAVPPNQNPNSPTSLAQKKTDDTSLAVGAWTNETSVKFSATVFDPDSADTLYLCVEKDILGTSFSGSEDLCGSGVAYSGTAVEATVTISGITDANQYHWQARVKDEAGAYSSWVSFGENLETERDFGVDTSAPSGGTVYDGEETGVDKSFNNGSLSQLSANWANFDAGVSGLDYYQYAIGTSASGTDVKTWTSAGASTAVTATDLTLVTSTPYYFSVRAVDKAGNIQSPAISSNGQLVAPSLIFSVSPDEVSFTNLNAGNDYTDSKMVTLTTSTNAYNGYLVRAFITDYLRSADNAFTIADFDGGTYEAPDEWLTGDRGFGYYSSDILVGGVNKFNSTPCPGGGSPPCFAPFSHSEPGEVIADHTANVSGIPISNEKFEITLKVKTDAGQPASTYSTNIIYTVTAKY